MRMPWPTSGCPAIGGWGGVGGGLVTILSIPLLMTAVGVVPAFIATKYVT